MRAADGIERRFEAVIFDWDGTAVPDRDADASPVRERVEALCRAGVDVAVVSGTHLENIDGQLRARPSGPGHLHLSLNRGSEVFAVDASGPHLRHRRIATPAEDTALTAAARLLIERLAARGLETAIVPGRLNRCKIDLIPLAEWRSPPKARIGELLNAVHLRLSEAGLTSLEEVVSMARQAAREVGLHGARVTTDAKHAEIGLTDKSDAARWLRAELWAGGIGSALVLVVGDEMGRLGGVMGSDALMLLPGADRITAASVGVEPAGVPWGVVELGGGPSRFLEVLDDQLARRRGREVPQLDEAPGWTVAIEGLHPELERVHETLLTLGNGSLGTRGASPLAHEGATPSVLLAGVYEQTGSGQHLLPAPLWARLPATMPPRALVGRRLDLRTGTLHHQIEAGEQWLEAVAFCPLSRAAVAVIRAQGSPGLVRSGGGLAPGDRRKIWDEGEEAGQRWMRVSSADGTAAIVGCASEVYERGDGGARLDRLAAYTAGREVAPSSALLRSIEDAGFDRLLLEHRRAWARRWDECDISVDADPALQQQIRFGLFHLMGSVSDAGESAVGARGLSGPAYHGHVFWDSDVFVLPFFAATHPASARAMLEYRIRRLPAARALARERGLRGARFPWESARDGDDVTPRLDRAPNGEMVAIATGDAEEHIVADVAWAAACYLDWSGDQAFATGSGLQLLVETARYWDSRIERDTDGRAHIRRVIGPDEYHEYVDDNAFTNVLARWNLRRAARTAAGHVEPAERSRWLAAAEALVDGYDPATGVYEQFAGFSALDPLVIGDIVPRRPVAADLLLGHDRVENSQVVKQADVLMLHFLVPEETAPHSLLPNLERYEPRTAHGSSLSPAVHAALLARAGRLADAAHALRLASSIDWADLTGSTAGGLHLAAMAGSWQAMVRGFLGVSVRGDCLVVDPRVDPSFGTVQARLRFRGVGVTIRAAGDAVTVRTAGPVAVAICGDESQTVDGEAIARVPGPEEGR